jgi:hypothetical protein
VGGIKGAFGICGIGKTNASEGSGLGIFKRFWQALQLLYFGR